MSATAGRPLVTVAMSVLHDADAAVRTIAGVLSQTLAEWEFIVADDSPGDATAARIFAATGSDPRFRYIHDDSSRGEVANWNAALAAASGEYLQVLRPGTVLAPGALFSRYRAAHAAGAADVVAAGLPLGDGGESGAPARVALLQAFPLDAAALMIRVTAARESGGFDEMWSGDAVFALGLHSLGRLSVTADSGLVAAPRAGWRARVAGRHRKRLLATAFGSPALPAAR